MTEELRCAHCWHAQTEHDQTGTCIADIGERNNGVCRCPGWEPEPEQVGPEFCPECGQPLDD